LYNKDGTKSRILILNQIYDSGVSRLGREFSVERLLRSIREMKVYMKEFGHLTNKTRLEIATNPLMVLDGDQFC